MGLRVVHLSNNSLAGAPLRLTRAIGALPGFSARLVETRDFGLYGRDVDFSQTPELGVELCEKADILHLHNFLDLDSGDFRPIDFRALQRRGKRIVRQFHSAPDLVAARMGRPLEAVLGCPLPSLVIAQYPERFYPGARVVPNILPQDDPAYRPSGKPPLWDVFFAPTKPSGAFENRWNTKGAPETLAMLRALARRTGCAVNARDGDALVPLAWILEEKGASRIALDDMVNGSYHLSGLEGLSLGRPTLTYLDERTLFLLREFSGSADCPFVNVRLEEAAPVIGHLLRNPEEAEAVGRFGREWIETHWRDATLAGHFAAVYRDLAEDPALIRRQDHLRLDGVRRFFVMTLGDLIYEQRKKAAAAASDGAPAC